MTSCAAAHPDCADETHLNLTSALERLNRLEDAKAALAAVRQPQAPGAVLLRARLLRRDGDAAAALQCLDLVPPENLASQGAEIQGDWQQEIGFAADRLNVPTRAFPAFLAAKAAWSRTAPPIDGQSYRRQVERLRHAAAPPPIARSAQPRLAFLVGFPRSGTTLLEVMLDAHEKVRTTQEQNLLSPLFDEDGRLRSDDPAADYMRAATAALGPIPSDMLLIDKLPLNLIHCRGIDAALPGSRLLVALRDPRDVVLSCLMQRFRRNIAMVNFDSLESTVQLYEAVMGLWLLARDGLQLPVLQYRYEDLVADWRTTLERILSFLDLPWTDAMDHYREHAQDSVVKTPSYRDIAEPLSQRASGRWRRYRAELEPALPRLAPFAEAFGYEPA